MNKSRRILILTADAGFGHRSAANAIEAALQQSYGDACAAEVVNALDHRLTPGFLRDIVVQHRPHAIVTTYPLYQAPLVLIDVIPGQETGNPEYVVQGGAGAPDRSTRSAPGSRNC